MDSQTEERTADYQRGQEIGKELLDELVSNFAQFVKFHETELRNPEVQHGLYALLDTVEKSGAVREITAAPIVFGAGLYVGAWTIDESQDWLLT